MKTCPRILLVEDDTDSAEALCLLLQTHGIGVEWAATAGEAMARFEAHRSCPLNAIILDLMLPDLDGVSLIAQLRRIGPVPPIVIHSAATKQATEAAGAALNAAAVLRKPATWEQMRDALQRCGAFPHVETG